MNAESKVVEKLGNGWITSLNTSNGTRARMASERAHDGAEISGAQRGQISADNVTQLGVCRLEQGPPDVTLPVDRPLAAIRAEHHRQLVGGLGNDGYRPIHRLTVVVVQMRQQFDYGPPVNTGGGNGFDAGVALSPQQLIVTDKPSKLSMTAHLPLPGVVNRHLAGPYFFEFVSAPGLDGVEVPLHGISKTDGPCLATGEFNGTSEIRKPWHFTLDDPFCSGSAMDGQIEPST